jgi:hypothetical protein
VLSSRVERVRGATLVRVGLLGLLCFDSEPVPSELAPVPAPAPPSVELGASGAELGVAVPDPVEVLAGRLRAGGRGRVWRVVVRSGTVGANPRPAEIGSEESPMCWLVSWLVAHVMPAVSTSPSSAASVQVAVCLLIGAP